MRTEIRKANFDTLMPIDYVILLICLILIPSAVVQGLIGIDEKAAFSALAPIVLVGSLLANRLKIPSTSGVTVWVLLATGAIASILAESSSQILMSFSLLIAIFAGLQLSLTMMKPKALLIASWFALAMLLGGLVGIVYCFVGAPPLMELKVGYRTTYLYLTTFSFARTGNFIRPSGIFDEPGSLAMFVAIITMWNDILKTNRLLNIALISLLFFSGSVAGVVVSVLYLLTSNTVKAHLGKSIALISVLIGSFFVMYLFFPENPLLLALNAFYESRFQVVDGRFVGDNRSNQIEEFFQLVDEEILVRGQKAATKQYYFTDMTSNPFSITFAYGLIISLPYFALLFWLGFITFKNKFRNSYSSIGLLLLLLQRPYTYNMAWSILIASVVWLLSICSRGGAWESVNDIRGDAKTPNWRRKRPQHTVANPVTL